jgi:hypothetical protein
MAASPYDQRKKTHKARLDEVRQKAQSRMETVAKLERRGTTAPRSDVIGRTGKAEVIGPTEGQTGRAKVMNGDKFPSVAKARADQTTRQLWRVGLGEGNTAQRQATRGNLVIKGDQRYYRRRSDGKAIPIDSSGRVIRRRRGVSP